MKEGWKQLGTVADIYNGDSINAEYKKKHFVGLEDGYPFIATKDVSPEGNVDYNNGVKIPEDAGLKVAPADSVFVCAEGGSAGKKIAHIDQDVCFGNKLFCIAPKDKSRYSAKYIYYFCRSEKFREQFFGELTGLIGGVSSKKFKSIECPFPPLPEQERIVSYFDAQFAKIDALKANTEQQLQAAKDLFQSALKEMLTPKEGWEEKVLKDICTSIKDGDWIERKDQSISGIRLLQTGNIGVGIYKDKSDSPHYISLDTFNRLHCEEVFEGDILLSRLPEPVGRACLVPKMEGRFITAVDCSIIKLNTDKISPEYFIFYTQTNAYFKNISSLCTGTTRQRISRKRLEEVPISFPSLPEQERIAARLDAISEKVKALQANYDQTINLCNDLKQALLKSIFE